MKTQIVDEKKKALKNSLKLQFICDGIRMHWAESSFGYTEKKNFVAHTKKNMLISQNSGGNFFGCLLI